MLSDACVVSAHLAKGQNSANGRISPYTRGASPALISHEMSRWFNNSTASVKHATRIEYNEVLFQWTLATLRHCRHVHFDSAQQNVLFWQYIAKIYRKKIITGEEIPN